MGSMSGYERMKQLAGEADNIFSPSVEIKNDGSIPPLQHTYIFMI
jgi:hypothetical protein